MELSRRIPMEKIMFEAGKLVGDTFENILKNKENKPKLVTLKDDKIEVKEYSSNLEESIPAIMEALDKNEKKADFATAVFPAEMEDRKKIRQSIVLAVIYDYKKEFYLNIIMPYELKDDKLELKKCDWMNIKGVLRKNLSVAEEEYKKGISQNPSSKEFWKEGICY
jgi:hypothetical protein